MGINHYDSLIGIVCHALSQGHPGVLKEKHVSCADHSHQRNVYYPSLIFSMAVLLILMCQFVTLLSLTSSSCAGITAAARELAKDQRHQDAIEVPLAVKKHLVFGHLLLFELYKPCMHG